MKENYKENYKTITEILGLPSGIFDHGSHYDLYYSFGYITLYEDGSFGLNGSRISSDTNEKILKVIKQWGDLGRCLEVLCEAETSRFMLFGNE